MTNEQDEIWRDIPKYMGIYQASSFGRIRRILPIKRIPYGQIRIPHIDRKGYERLILQINNKKHLERVHRLVALAFHGERPNGMQVNHIDCNKRNNRPENLEYVTNSENMRHAVANGLFKNGKLRGEKSPEATITNGQAKTIKLMLRDTKRTARQIAQYIGCTIPMVYSIKYKKAWKTITISDDDKLDDQYLAQLSNNVTIAS